MNCQQYYFQSYLCSEIKFEIAQPLEEPGFKFKLSQPPVAVA